MPTFWGARAPDQVLADGNYLRAAGVSHNEPPAQQQMLKHLMHRVDWLRDIRGFDYYDRLAFMIQEWAELGMVLPVEDPPASLSVKDLRVEQGRNHKNVPIDDAKNDQKYHLTEDVENLFAEPTAGMMQARAGRIPAPPPKRRYRQGEI
jgi:hypothetical protein